MSERIEQITIYTDGASRGNPGPAAAGFVLTDDRGNEIAAKGLYIGEATNNVAEYTGLVKALEESEQFRASKLCIYSDSELMVKQINGIYKVKSELIRPLYERAVSLLGKVKNYTIKHVPRGRNVKADSLCNKALDIEGDVQSKAPSPGAGQKHLRIGVMLSGGGTTVLNILDYIRAGKLNAEIPVVISSRSTVKGVERAKNAKLDVKIVRKKDYPDIESFSKELEKTLDAAKVDLVILTGWLCQWKIPEKYTNKVMNIHPALLPSFGGRGMWGHYVHEAVLARGCKISGCSVHFCTNEYDEGPIIVQRSCPVAPDDTPDTLAARVFEQECAAYPTAIKLFAQDRLRLEGSKVRILPESRQP